MNEFNRFSEHYRIDQFLKKKTSLGTKSKTMKRHENILSNFPVGLIILAKEELKYEDKVEFINNYACKLFRIKENINIKDLKEKFNEFVKLKNSKTKTSKTLTDIIFNYSSFNLELENFVPFECTYSKNIILYIKINEIDNEKYIVIDKYDKYIEEQKYIELNLIKTINYQYLHTLYHELNNPLNALLAIAGEKEKSQIFSSEIGNSKIEERPSYKTIKQFKKLNKKDKKSSLLYLNNQESFDNNKLRRRTLVENSDLNNKIPLLVNIIKIFIKNFILYLKIRADTLLSLKNEFDAQNETSDIMNAVEVSDYEKEITKHKNVKMNLEYFFQLYLVKFKCLFNYKEIEYETNFERLRNIYVVTDEFNFIYYIRQIYTYLYYIIPKKEGFIFEYDEDMENNTIKIIIKNRNNEIQSRRTAEPLGYNNKDNNKKLKSKDDMDQVIQTKEMTKEVLYFMSKKLCFSLEIYDIENFDHSNKYLCVTMPMHKRDKSEEEDEFKDEDINEMIQKNSYLLEDKLKRQIPVCETIEQRKSNNSTHNYDNNSKNWRDNESSIFLQKKDMHLKTISDNNLKNLRDNCSNISHKKSKKFSEKDLSNFNNLYIINDSQKKVPLLSNKFNDNFLNKCLKIADNKKTDVNNKDNSRIHEKKSDNLLKLHINGKVKNYRSDKSLLYNNIPQKTEYEIKSQKLSGVFTKINNLGHEEELNCNDLSISNIIDDIQDNKKEDLTLKNNNNNKPNLSKTKQIKDNKLINNLFNLEMNTRSRMSTNVKSFTVDKQNSKLKGSCIFSEAIEGENNSKNINININNNNVINIINDSSLRKSNFINNLDLNNQDKKNENMELMNQQKIHSTLIKPSPKKGKSTKIKLTEIDKKQHKRLSENISPKINPKECMTFFGEEKKDIISKDKKTILNDSIRQNSNLFLEANKERELHLQNCEPKISVSNGYNFEEEEMEGEEEEEEAENEEEEEQCNCFDILVVDDEEFNVMAAQKMMKNLGYGSDAAYNGEECINLIKEKQKLNCQCNRNYYKIIFLDIVMPVLDGIKTAKKIQEMIDNKEINENIQIIFVSGNIDGDELKKSLLQINCVKECLQKPVKIDKYQKILEKYLKNT